MLALCSQLSIADLVSACVLAGPSADNGVCLMNGTNPVKKVPPTLPGVDTVMESILQLPSYLSVAIDSGWAATTD